MAMSNKNTGLLFFIFPNFYSIIGISKVFLYEIFNPIKPIKNPVYKAKTINFWWSGYVNFKNTYIDKTCSPTFGWT